MTPEATRRARREAAGFVYVKGYLPADHAAKVQATIDAWADEVARIEQTDPPRGRPKNSYKELAR